MQTPLRQILDVLDIFQTQFRWNLAENQNRIWTEFRRNLEEIQKGFGINSGEIQKKIR